MSDYLQIHDFLRLRDDGILLLDARSEKEFIQGHISAAQNLPLLNNEHRHLVGTAYKQKGREAAVELGFELAGPLFSSFIKQAKELTTEKRVLVYCWRGGMRSGIMSWILSMAGYKISVLKGGYKTYRNFILQKLSEEFQLAVISGKTGSGKTAILNEMKKSGAQVLDLENLANHRGSAFGQIGLPPQPSNEQFENRIGEELLKLNTDHLIWVEGESHSIGRNKIPDHFFNLMQSAPMVEISATLDHRMKRILDEYGVFETKALIECTEKLKKRLGDLRMRMAVDALLNDDKETWLNIVMEYYDKTYSYSIAERTPPEKQEIIFKETDELNTIAKNILNLRFATLAK